MNVFLVGHVGLFHTCLCIIVPFSLSLYICGFNNGCVPVFLLGDRMKILDNIEACNNPINVNTSTASPDTIERYPYEMLFYRYAFFLPQCSGCSFDSLILHSSAFTSFLSIL